MNVTLRVGAREWSGWKTIDVTRSIEQAASSFRIAAASRGATQTEPLRIRPGAACEILVDDEPLLTGYIDGVDTTRDNGGLNIAIEGRSRTSDLIDCSIVHPSGQIKNRTILDICDELTAPYNVGVFASFVGDVPKIPMTKWRPGETPFEVIDRLARNEGLLVTDTREGFLHLTTAGNSRASVALVTGKNVLSMGLSCDASRLYRDYIANGQRAGGDDDYGAATTEVSESARDAGVLRNRTLILSADGQVTPATAARRARWEAASRAGQATRITATVQGWHQTVGGPLWDCNLLVSAIDADLGVNGTFLISEVTYHLGEDGTITSLSLAPQNAYLREPPEEQKRSGPKSARAGVTAWEYDEPEE